MSTNGGGSECDDNVRTPLTKANLAHKYPKQKVKKYTKISTEILL